jgi:two-component system sensor histidine kinase RegB
MRAFLDAIVGDWRASRPPGTFDYADRFGEDMAIVSDPALRQVIGNVIDNAAEASPDWIGVTASREGDALVLDIADRGPGFSPEMLDGFGHPYRSTKGRAGGGLGLFLLVNVLRKMGGAAQATNRPDGGANVRIRLPLAALAYAGPIR